ncbi:DUF5776 domain-containing protein, partial [Apilactobacillus sp. TMW 2.2459]|uniref:DUF5776 domain-containing protein n=1 Tax=Apilactobacillus xinyiensis TaxID=2841032 RepID=UPI00200BFB8A
TAQDIADAYNTGKQNIDAAYKPGKSLQEQKAIAKGNLNEEAFIVDNRINADPTLSKPQKNDQHNDVRIELNIGNDNINKSNTAQEIEDAYNSGKQKIDSVYHSGTPIEIQREIAKSKLYAEADLINGKIDADTELTDDQKIKQHGDVTSALNTGNSNIDKANSFQEIEDAYNQGKKNIDDAYRPGSSFTINNGSNTNKTNETNNNNSSNTNNYWTYLKLRAYSQKNKVKFYYDKSFKRERTSLKKYTNKNYVMYKVLGRTKSSKNGYYKVQMISNKTGRLSSEISYVPLKYSKEILPLYYLYDSKETSVRVINKRVFSYKNINLTDRKHSYSRGDIIKTKSIVKDGPVYRFRLMNGQYLTANKLFVKKIN